MRIFWKVMLERMLGNCPRQRKSNLAGDEVTEPSVWASPRKKQSALLVTQLS